MRIAVGDGSGSPVGLDVALDGAGPPLFCVHGLGGVKEDFADHVEALSERATVVRLDLRGHGTSDRAVGADAYSLDRCAADVLDVAGALGFERFRLLGHSMGGMIVRRVVVAAPERVEGVVFMSTAAGPPKGLTPELVDLGAELARTDWPGLHALLEESKPLGTPAFERLLAERPRPGLRVEALPAVLDPEAWAMLAPEIAREPDSLDGVRQVTTPTLVMVGLLDAVFLDASRALASAVPGADLAEIPDAGHHPQFENPQVWRRDLEHWLDQLDQLDRVDQVRSTRPRSNGGSR